MCLICIEVANERMSIAECRKALSELIDSAESSDELEHYKKLKFSSNDSIKEIAEAFVSEEAD